MMEEIYKFWKEVLEEFKNNNSQGKNNNPQGETFLESFCSKINLKLDKAVIKWLEEGFSPGEAKEWMDKNFSLERAKEWRNNGVRSPEGAQYWESQKYAPNDAGKKISQIINQVFCSEQAFLFNSGEMDIWIKAGFSPGEAAVWIAFGFSSPKEAAAWMAAGFSPPAEAAMWRDKEFSPGQVAAWKAFGFSLSQAIGLRDKYGSPFKALKALRGNDIEAWELFNNSNNPPNNPLGFSP